MLAKSLPKVSLESRLSRENYDAKFGMDECARNNYRVTLSLHRPVNTRTYQTGSYTCEQHVVICIFKV